MIKLKSYYIKKLLYKLINNQQLKKIIIKLIIYKINVKKKTLIYTIKLDTKKN